MKNNYVIKIYVLVLVVFILPAIHANARESGEKLYVQNCMVCHADDGGGAMPGVSDLNENSIWLSIPEPTLIMKLKQGINTPGSTITMPPNGGNPDLTDNDLKEIILYMKTTFKKQTP